MQQRFNAYKNDTKLGIFLLIVWRIEGHLGHQSGKTIQLRQTIFESFWDNRSIEIVHPSWLVCVLSRSTFILSLIQVVKNAENVYTSKKGKKLPRLRVLN